MSESKALKPIDEVRGNLQKLEPQFKMALPPHIPAERFLRIVITAVQNMPALLNCDRQSLYSAAMLCAQDGLLLDGREAALVPYGDKVRYTPMVNGICKRARNSGEIKTMNAHVVYENDEYDAWVDETGEHFSFRRAKGDRGAPRLTFAYAITKSDGFFFEEISEDQMLAIEQCSKARNSPWKGPFRDEMKRKSAIRRLAKYRLPSSTDLDEIIRRDDEMYTVEPEQPRHPLKSSRLSQLVNADGDAQEFSNNQPPSPTVFVCDPQGDGPFPFEIEQNKK